MVYDYDKLYGQTPDALGQPTSVFVEFFDRIDRQNARVLDVGCGQGRDALFIARKGHRVVGVDISPNGIRDLAAAAQAENLPIDAVVADLATYTPDGVFDVIVIDRTLHMLPEPARHSVFGIMLDYVEDTGWLLIADEASNIDAFKAICAAHHASWTTLLSRRGYLFLRRT